MRQREDGLRRGDPDEKEEDHGALRFEQRNIQDAVRDQQDQQRDHERSNKSGEPRQRRVALLARVMGNMGEMRFLSRSADDVATVQEHGGLEQSMRNQL